jgi:uncharacterized protein
VHPDHTAAAPAHPFASQHGAHLLVVDRSRIYDLEPALADEVTTALAAGGPAAAELLTRYGLDGTPGIADAPLTDPPIRALSLAIAQACNLSCGYCYAQGGSFGGKAKNMEWPVVHAAVLRLLEDAGPGERVNLAFLGGEPLVNRALLRQATEFAADEARQRGIRIGFSITTNGTLLNADDGDFLEQHGFAVTVSLDGVGEQHDRLRPFRGGAGSYERVLARVSPLLARQKNMQVSARVTVTPLNLDLPTTLDAFIELGFHSVGFSPMLSAPRRQLELAQADIATMLEQMIACGRTFETETIAGRRYPFSNMSEALRQIHRGSHRPYPCGAGAGYFGVSADGGLFACHRFVDDKHGRMGNLADGLDRDKRNAWLADRHVHRQEPCRSCWARYLCGGGCHHEVIHRGRPACDYIRGWLHYCLGAYVNIMEACPSFFSPARSNS